MTNKEKPYVNTSILYVFRRLPFTIALLAVLSLIAWVTNSHSSRLHPAWLQKLGFSVQDLWALRIERLFSAAVTTHGSTVFWQAMGMVSLSVGAAEWLAGTKRAFLTFWGAHLLTMLVESVFVVPYLHLITAVPQNILLAVRDVGPSAGYFGCLGLAIYQLPSRWRQVVAGSVLAGLALTLFRPAHVGETEVAKLFADLAHLIAFPLGYLSGKFYTSHWAASHHLFSFSRQREVTTK